MRGWIYDRALLATTRDWYAAVLGRVPQGARLLDVGVGTAGALIAHADLVRQRDLAITGIDIDPDYVRRARKRLSEEGLSDAIAVHHQGLEAHHGGPYDAVYFAGSFMLFPDPAGALRQATALLAEGGRIYFTQTFQERVSPWLERLKPVLKALTTIDFGTVTYEDDFHARLQEAGLHVVEEAVLTQGRVRSARVVIAEPAG